MGNMSFQFCSKQGAKKRFPEGALINDPLLSNGVFGY